MKILSVAYPFAPVAPWTAGGAEQVLLGLDGALTRRGHESVVIAAAGSRVTGKLVELPPIPPGAITDDTRAVVWQQTRDAVTATLRAARFDAVHYHGIDFHEYLPETPTPSLVTLHLPISWYPPQTLAPRPNVWLHCVSHAQQAGAPAHGQLLPPIPNGVQLRAFWPRERKRAYLLVAGRICPEKAPHLALDAARMAGRTVLLAGQVYPYETHVRYFEQEVKPRLGRFLGPVGGARKRRLFAGASALLVPSQAPETSSLVAMEAMASATPVIAFASGALASLICHGHNGFLVHSTEEMAESIRQLHWIRPSACRAFAESRFDFRRTAAAYLDRYRDIASA
jgi:glycosyltransferase involved in cell wall biosynthesis